MKPAPHRLLLPLILGAVLYGGIAQAKVAPGKLEDMAGSSDVIVLARVEEVISVRDLKVARAVPQEVFKGSLKQESFSFVASPTWACDISDAVRGETALLFLRRAKGSTVSLDGLGKPAVTIDHTPLYRIAWSGRGRMPLRMLRGERYTTLWTGDVILPRGIETVPGPEARYASFIRSARLSDILRVITPRQRG
jgi:hypothetical protein